MRLLVAPIRFVWRWFWRLVRWTIWIIFLTILVLIILIKTNHITVPETWTTIRQWLQISQAPTEVAETVDSLQQLLTDHAPSTNGGRWTTNHALVYIETTEPTYRTAYLAAMENWNATGAFTFELTENREEADIIATSMNDANTQAAGQADSSMNALTHYFTTVTVSLNDYYLLNPEYGYNQERITHTAEHELGHAIGLPHNDQESSVMASSGSYQGIQTVDIQAVNQIYQ